MNQEETNPKKKTKKKFIEIPPPDLRIVQMTLIGDAPLMVNNFGKKSEQELADKDGNLPKPKRGPRDIQAEYESSFYRMGKNKYGIPASGIKKAAVSACRFVEGVPMATALGAFFILGDDNNLVEVISKPPRMDTRIVRIGKFPNKIPQLRYRGIFDSWKVTFKVRYNAGIISPAQLLHLYELAGFSIGVCEYRPEKGGTLGRFHVARK